MNIEIAKRKYNLVNKVTNDVQFNKELLNKILKAISKLVILLKINAETL